MIVKTLGQFFKRKNKVFIKLLFPLLKTFFRGFKYIVTSDWDIFMDVICEGKGAKFHTVSTFKNRMNHTHQIFNRKLKIFPT